MGTSLTFDLFARDRASGPIGKVGSSADKLASDLENADGKASIFGDGLSKLGGVAAAGAVAGLAAIGGAADLLGQALDQGASTDRLAAALGATPAQAAKYGKLASNLYAGAWGESLDDVSHSVEAVASSFPDLGGKQLKQASIDALNYSAIFDTDVPRAVSVAQNVVASGLAKTSTEAFDLMTSAAQKVPVALRENVLDAADEYGSFFHTIGFDGPQAFGVLAAGAQQGQYGIDKAGDAVKEFTIRSTDMSTSSVAAYKAIGLNAGDMADKILKGGDTAARATQQIIGGLLKIQDPAKRANAAIALFGTPLEDIGVHKIPDFLRALQSGSQGLDDWKGSIDRAGQTLNDNAKTNIEGFKRSLQMNVVNYLGSTAVPAIEGFIDEMHSGKGAGGAFADGMEQVGGALHTITKFGGGAADAVGHLPSPLRDSAIQGGLLLGAVSQLAPALQRVIDKAVAARGALSGVGGGMLKLRAGAGVIGGAALAMGEMADKADGTNSALSNLADVGGGALLGFAAGGPLGAAIGGGIGLVKALGDQSVDTSGQVDSLTSSLNEQTGALTANSREMVARQLQESGAASAAQAMGLDLETVTSAALGNRHALADVNLMLDTFIQTTSSAGTAAGGASEETAKLAEKARFLKGEIGGSNEVVAKARAEFQQHAALMGADTKNVDKLAHALRGMPKEVRTRLKNDGYKTSRSEVDDLQKRYGLTPKEVATIMRVLNVHGARKDVKSVQDDVDHFDRSRPTPILSTKGQDQVAGTMRWLTGEIVDYGRQHPNPTLNANAGPALGAIAGVSRDLRNLDGDTATTYITTIRKTLSVFDVTGSPNPKRAVGGRVEAGERYTVGEFGRESFVPDVPGRIRSNAATLSAERRSPAAQGVVVHQSISVQVVSSGNGERDADQLIQALRRRKRELGGVPLGLS